MTTMNSNPLSIAREDILRRVGRIEQVASIRRYVIDDGKGRGSRAFEVRNGSGFEFTVHPDRGLDIGAASFNGLPVAWTTPNGTVAPAFYDDRGAEWLRSWQGGLLTTCGLLSVGPECDTPEGHQGQHGRFDNIPAEGVNTSCRWENGRYVMEVTGDIAHTRVFCEKIVCHRTIRTVLGEPFVEVEDRFENMGYEPVPLTLLYHMNLGWPLVDEGARLFAAAHKVVARDAKAEVGIGEWDRMIAPSHGFAEQVFYHDIPAGADGHSVVSMVNEKLGISLEISFDKKELPNLVQWRMMGEGEYICGIEPANCYPEGQPAIKACGMLRMIAPGETVCTHVRAAVRR